MKDQTIDLPEHDCLYETTNDSGFIDQEPAYRKSTVLRLIEADRQRRGEPVAYPVRAGCDEGLLAKRPYQKGDNLPAVGSYCLVSGANCDIESDQHRSYLWRQVLGYSDDKEFICLQTSGYWPTVERLTKCWFADIPHPMGGAPQPAEPEDKGKASSVIVWEHRTASEYLDRLGIRKDDGEDCLSLWGRIVEAFRSNGITIKAPLIGPYSFERERPAEPVTHNDCDLSGQFERSDIENHRLRRAMQKIMARLTELLDEDQFATIEGIATDAGVEPPAEPVKVPSNTDIDEVSREWGLQSAAYPSKSMVRDFARALLARYGAQPAAPDWSAINAIIGKHFKDDPANACRAHAAIAEVLRAQPAASAEPVASGEWSWERDGERIVYQSYQAAMNQLRARGGTVTPLAAPVAAQPVDGTIDIEDHIASEIAQGKMTREEFLEARKWVRDTYYPVAAEPNLYDGDTLTAAYMAGQDSARVPDGWKLVPVEPTDEMYEAWLEGKGDQRNYWNDVYAAMLAAAPTPPADEQTQQDKPC